MMAQDLDLEVTSSVVTFIRVNEYSTTITSKIWNLTDRPIGHDIIVSEISRTTSSK